MTGRRRGRAVAAVLAPLLLVGAAACDSGGKGTKGDKGDEGGKDGSGNAVFSLPPADQLVAARTATEGGGTVRFVSTLVYTAKGGGQLTDRTTGSQDFGADRAVAVQVQSTTGAFPQKAVAALRGENGRAWRSYSVEGDDVLYRTAKRTWLRYAASAGDISKEAALLSKRAGSTTPYGGTLADAVFGSFPEARPEKRSDGTRYYHVMTPAGVFADLVPDGFAPRAGSKGEAVPVSLEVELDAQGRLTRAEADLSALITDRETHGVTGIKAHLAFSEFGHKAPPSVRPGERTEDASKVLTELTKIKPGECAGHDTGLAGFSLLRRVDCSTAHDLRIFGQVRINETSKERIGLDGAYKMAQDRCEERYTDAPAAWTAKGRPAGTFYTLGAEGMEILGGGPGDDISIVKGDFTCYVKTS
ncbi:hypothetical protein [Streptomyces sp. NPDC050504]|uniref:hypothetical protein n=1 Tax=Streptomyces sp. NPDC050504 TaxID=3365618 RepID=UPI0037B5A7BF